MTDIYAKIPQPLASIGCQDLLKQPVSFCGWVRKRHLASKLKIFRWPKVYMVISTGCVYYFKNEYCKSPAGKFSLFGFNCVSRAQDVKVSEAYFPFKIDHLHTEFKSYYFACSSEMEMKQWMKAIKEELKLANNPEKRDGDYYYTEGFTKMNRAEQTPEAQGFSNDSGFGPSGDGDSSSITYKDIEESIYDDPNSFKPPDDYGLYTKKADEDSDEELLGPPPIPPRAQVQPAASGKKSKSKDGKGKKRRKKKESSEELPEESKPSASKPDNAAKEMAAALSKEMEGRFAKQENSGAKRKTSNASQSSVEEDVRKMSIVSDTGADDIDEDEEEDADDYWKAIYYDGDNTKSGELIRDLGEDGVYLVRSGSADGSQVLVVFAENMPKKYKIQNKDGQYFLAQAGPHADSLEELLYEYYETNLPNTSVVLSTPFQHHPKYNT